MRIILSKILVFTLIVFGCAPPDNQDKNNASVSIKISQPAKVRNQDRNLSANSQSNFSSTDIEAEICFSPKVGNDYSDDDKTCFEFTGSGTKTINLPLGEYSIAGRVISGGEDYYFSDEQFASFASAGSKTLSMSFESVETLFDTNIQEGTYTGDQNFQFTQINNVDQFSYSTDGTSFSDDSSATIPVSGNGAEQEIKVRIIKNGFELFHKIVIRINYSQTSTPFFNISDSSEFYSDQVVEISSDRPAAQFYYTTDGSAPTNSSTLYTGPITYDTDGTYTIRTIAYETGYSESTVRTVNFEMSFFSAEAYLKANNPGAGDQFSSSLAIHGDIIVVGAQEEDGLYTGVNDDTVVAGDGGVISGADGSGAVYVYQHNGSQWEYTHYLKPESLPSGEEFGSRVDVYGDTIVVGFNDYSSASGIVHGSGSVPTDTGASSSGAAYVFRQSGDTWVQEAFIKRIGNEFLDVHRYPRIYEDTIVVSSYNDDSSSTIVTNSTSIPTDNNSTDVGALFVYTRTGVTWSHQAMIKASGLKDNDHFGENFDFAENTIVVGVPADDDESTTIQYGENISLSNTGNEVGGVWVFDRSGDQWAQTAYIKAPNGESWDYLASGFRSLAYDNDTLVVGAPFEDGGEYAIINSNDISSLSADASGTVDSGAAYVFVRENGLWELQAYLKGSHQEAGEQFGTTIDLDGDLLAVSAYQDENTQQGVFQGTNITKTNGSTATGSVYIFQRTGTEWKQIAYFKATNNAESGGFTPYEFGLSKISVNGDRILVGHEHEDNSHNAVFNGNYTTNDFGLNNAGAAFIFSR